MQCTGCELAAPSIHSAQCCQADCIPDTGMNASRSAHQPELLPRGVPPTKLSRQGSAHSGCHGALPEVVTAAGVGCGGAAQTRLRAAAGHASCEGEGVQHEAPIHLLVLILPRQLPQPRQQVCHLAAGDCSALAVCCCLSLKD